MHPTIESPLATYRSMYRLWEWRVLRVDPEDPDRVFAAVRSPMTQNLWVALWTKISWIEANCWKES